MTKSRWFTLIVLAVIGYGALFALYPRYSPAMRWNFQLDRATAINRANEVTRSYGLETAGWKAEVKTQRQRDSQLSYYLRNQPNPVVATWLPSIFIEVKLNALNQTGRAIVWLTPQGRAIRYCRERCRNEFDPDPNSRRGNERASEKGDERQPSAPNTAANQPAAAPDPALAVAAFKTFADNQQQLFESQPTVTRDQKSFKHIWTASINEDKRLKLLAEISLQDNQVREAALNPDFSEAFQHEAEAYSNPTPKLLQSLLGFLLLPFSIICLFLFFISWGNGEILHRQALLCLGLCLLFLLAVNFSDDLNINISLKQSALATLARGLAFALSMLVFALPLYLFWASGHSLAARALHRRTVAFELLLQGKLNNRYLAEQFAAGILLGGPLAALPFVLKALPFFKTATFAVRDSYEVFMVKSPALATLSSDHVYAVFLLFAFIVPLVENYMRRALLATLTILALGTVWLSGEGHFTTSAPGMLILGLGLTIGYYTIYRRFDFLTVLVSSISSMAALRAMGLLAQPLPSLQASGKILFAGLGAATLISFIVSWRGREVSQALFAPLIQATNRAERERLKAELEVASRAQQQMLPSEPPHLPGYDIAAICTPSKDVGGDLYDFINLPDGRLGIVVADVSGKGVPAALYMTLTKGLLASVAEEKSDPGEILREVNRHLYEACRKKVFVTLFLGVLDPVTRTLSYARAGHNPTVWRSALRNTTELLRSSGMGLGLNQGKVFNTSLKVATLQLEPNDALFFYSDGITEAMNAKQEEYGEERLMALAAKTDMLKAAAARDTIMADVKAFLGSLAPQDDQTLVILKVNA